MERNRPAGARGAAESPETESRGGPEPYRVAGEHAPIWLAAALGAVGTIMAVASASAWQSAWLALPARPPPVAAGQGPEQLARNGAVQESEAASTPREMPVAARPIEASPVAATPVAATPVAATPKPAGEAARPQMPVAVTPESAGEDAGPQAPQGAGHTPGAPPICFSAFDIPFARNSARPNMKGLKQSVEILRRWMEQHGNATLLVEGHADTTGTEEYNVLLSYSRAKAVAALLRRSGIPERRLTIRAAGAGEAQDGAAGLGSDRRAALRVEGVASCNGADDAMEER